MSVIAFFISTALPNFLLNSIHFFDSFYFIFDLAEKGVTGLQMQKDHIALSRPEKAPREDSLVYIVPPQKSYFYLFQLSCKT